MADYANLVYEIDSRSALKASGDLDKMTAAAGKAAGSADKLSRSTSSLSRSLGPLNSRAGFFSDAHLSRVSASLSAMDRTTDSIRASVSGLTPQVAAAGDAFDNASIKANRFADAQQRTSLQTANVFAQLNDIGVMLAAGQNPIQLALQQGTQLNQVWASMGKEGKTLSGVSRALGSAIFSMISPMNLLTIGVIAGGAALVQWATSAGNAGVSADEAVDLISGLSGAISSTTDSINSASLPLSELIEKYGNLAIQAQNAFEQQSRLSQLNLMAQIRGAQGSFAALTTDLRETVGLFDILISNAAYLTRAGQDNALALADARDQAEYLRDEYGLSVDDARELLRLIDAWGESAGPMELYYATESINEFIIEAAENGAKLPDELMAAATEAGNVNVQLLEMLSLINSLPNVAGVLFGGGGGETQSNSWTGVRPQARPQDIDFGAPIPGRTGGGGGGGGGMSEAERLRQQMQQRYDALIESFDSETQATMRHYQQGLESLQWALEQRVIAEEEYNARVAELRLINFGTEAAVEQYNYQMELQALQAALDAKYLTEEEYYMRRRQLQIEYGAQLQEGQNNLWSVELDGMAEAFGRMNQLAGGGYDSLLRAQKIFSAASALMSTYVGAAKALELPFPQNMLAMAKVMSAGLGLVNAIKGGNKANSAASAAATPTKTEPDRYVYLHLDGDQAMAGIVESMITQIYEQSKNGRVIIARGD